MTSPNAPVPVTFPAFIMHSSCHPQLAHCLLSTLRCHGPLGNILQVNWHLTVRVCEEGVALYFWSHLYPWRPFGLLVGTVSCPLLWLHLLVFPHHSIPPARLTDRQMLSAVHLELWASITRHKQPIARTQAANFACLSPFR